MKRGPALFLSPERQQAVRAQALGSECLSSSHQSLAGWPWASSLSKSGVNGMTFPFGSHVRLEQDGWGNALSSASCTGCPVTASKPRRVLVAPPPCRVFRPSHLPAPGGKGPSPPQPVIALRLRPFSLSRCPQRDGASCLSVPTTPGSLHSVTAGRAFRGSWALSLSGGPGNVGPELLATWSGRRKSRSEGSAGHPLSGPASLCRAVRNASTFPSSLYKRPDNTLCRERAAFQCNR